MCNADGDVIAALALVGVDARMDPHDDAELCQWLEAAAQQIRQQLP